MDPEHRKAAAAGCKERKSVAGIYAVRCQATGESWVGRADNLATIRNRVWFTLRHGGHPHRGLQEAWCTHGCERFMLEPLERLDDEPIAYVRDKLLNERLAHWRSALGAETI